jgi:processive 1,2-diacylglycerol beta-glucosyltransferase
VIRLPKTDVLILSASYGDGHQQAARALAAALQEAKPQLEVEILDFFRFVNPLFNAVTRCSYIQTVRLAPRLYGTFYRLTGNIAPDSVFQRRLNRLGVAKLAHFLDDRRPGLIVCTYPTPAGVLSELRRTGRVRVPVVTVITDNAVHSQWIHSHVDRYLVPCDAVRRGLLDRGVPPGRVAVTGIPINPKFARRRDALALREQWGLAPDVPVVLVMSGAYGMLGGTQDIARLLADFPAPLQAVVVCGHDRRLRQRLEPLARQASRPLHVFGFLNTIDELMAQADLLITKAGGLTTAEALAVGLPMLIYRPIPGQEEENTAFLTRAGAAVAAADLDALASRLRELLTQPERLAELRAAALAVRQPHAAETAARLLLELRREPVPTGQGAAAGGTVPAR